MQLKLLKLSPSGGYTNAKTAKDVLLTLYIRLPNNQRDAAIVGRCMTDILTRHAYLSTKMRKDKESRVRAETIHEKKTIFAIDPTAEAKTMHKL